MSELRPLTAADKDFVKNLMAKMTLAEKVGQLHMPSRINAVADHEMIANGMVGATLYASGATAGNERDQGVRREAVDSVQRVAMSSRHGIPLLVGRDVIHGHRTVFPIPTGQAAALDEELVYDQARRAALEAVAEGINWTFAPMLDLVDDARWGRVAESYGESPLVLSRLGTAAVRGFQSVGCLTACGKHYVGYGLARGGRDYAAAEIGQTSLRNMHLRPFKAAVDAGVGTIMAAFCAVDGLPMHANRHLIRDVLKGEWGFEGAVVADWDGIGELVHHGLASDLREAAKLAINAGVDIDMVTGAYLTHLVELVESGEVPVELVDEACARVLGLKVRLGLFDPENPALPGNADSLPGIEQTHHLDRDLARRGAYGAFVELKNDGVLPLIRHSGEASKGGGPEGIPNPGEGGVVKPGLVVLTGPYVNEQDALLGTWTLDGDPAEVTQIGKALKERIPTAIVDDGRFSDLTILRAREAETVIAVVGEHAARSGEDRSLATIDLPVGQLEYLQALSRVANKLVVVVFAGRPLNLAPVLPLANALIWAYHPGIEAGPALVDILLGDATASGRLPMTFAHTTGALPISHMEHRTGRPTLEAPLGAGRYQDVPSLPLVPFGTGHTDLVYGPLSVVSQTEDGVRVQLSVTNTANNTVREPVLLFYRDPVSAISRPIRELVDFQLATVAPGATELVTFALPTSAFGYYDYSVDYRVDNGEIELTAGWPRPDATSVTVTV